MKKFILFIFLVSFTIFGSYPFSKIEDVNKIKELSTQTDLFIEGKVIQVQQYYIHKKELRLISEQDITSENLGKIWIYTKLTVEVIDILKNSTNSRELKRTNDIIDVWISGGKLNLNNQKQFVNVSNTAYPFLDANDIMLMGLRKNSDSKTTSRLIEEYKNGYTFFQGTDLQIPSSERLIDEVEEGELQKARFRVEKLREKSLEKNSSTRLQSESSDDINSIDEFPSVQQLEANFQKASLKKLDIVAERKDFVKKIKQSFRRNNE